MTAAWRASALLLAGLLLAACGKDNVKPAPSGGASAPRAVTPLAKGPNPCAVVVDHDERHYTAGGLYAPHLEDGRPVGELDVSRIAEPVPQAEPRARYGNRSPYTVLGKTYRVMNDRDARRYVERGTASWYGTKFHGRMTSSLEPYDMCSFSAAHKTLPLPSYVRVTNLDNGRSVVVRVNDRGPFHAGRIIDLSYAAATRLGVVATGIARVEVRALDADGRLASGSAAKLASAPTPAGGRAVLQVGAYAEKDNAKRVARRLEEAGIDDVEIEDARVDGRKVWRVRVGPLAAAAVAAVAEQVAGLGFGRPRVFSE